MSPGDVLWSKKNSWKWEREHWGWVWCYKFSSLKRLKDDWFETLSEEVVFEKNLERVSTGSHVVSEPGWKPAERVWGRNIPGMFDVQQGGRRGWRGRREGDFVGGESRAIEGQIVWEVADYSQDFQFETIECHVTAAPTPSTPYCICLWALPLTPGAGSLHRWGKRGSERLMIPFPRIIIKLKWERGCVCGELQSLYGHRQWILRLSRGWTLGTVGAVSYLLNSYYTSKFHGSDPLSEDSISHTHLVGLMGLQARWKHSGIFFPLKRGRQGSSK